MVVKKQNKHVCAGTLVQIEGKPFIIHAIADVDDVASGEIQGGASRPKKRGDSPSTLGRR